MVNYLNTVKNFLTEMFTQNESVGLKGLEKIKVAQDFSGVKNDSELKILNIFN